MQHVFASFEATADTWSFPAIEARLESLGFRWLGTCTVDVIPSIREHVQGDMDDADLDLIDAASLRPWPIYWHEELKTYAWMTGWLDDQPILVMSTDFDGHSVLESKTRMRRMPRWRSKVEEVEAFQLLAHRPKLGSHVLLVSEDVDEHHAAHQVAVAELGGVPVGDGSIRAYLAGQDRGMQFKERLAIQPLVVGMVYQVAGAVLVFVGMLLWAALDPGSRSVGTAVGLLGLLLIAAARTWPNLLLQPQVRLDPPA